MESDTLVYDKKRLEWVDTLKGFLMIIVIWSHSLAFDSRYGNFLTVGYMAVFYWISGYLFKNKGQSFDKFIESKFRRLLIPYLLYGTLLVALGTVYYSLKHASPKEILYQWFGLIYGRYMLYPDNLANNVFFLKSFDSTLWFLLSMFLTYVLFYAINKMKHKSLCITILVLTGYLFTCSPILLPWSLDTVPVTVFFMWGGHQFKQCFGGKTQLKSKLICMIALFPICITATILNPITNLSIRNYGPGFYGYFLFLIASVSESAFLLLLFSCLRPLRFLSFIGKHTMTYMCLQIFTLGFSEVFLSVFRLNDFIVGWIGILFTLVGIGMLSIILDSIKHNFSIAKYL